MIIQFLTFYVILGVKKPMGIYNSSEITSYLNRMKLGEKFYKTYSASS